MLWSWGPQFASVNAMGCFGAVGNLRNAASLLFPCVENVIPLLIVPLMYLSIRFAASRCPCDGDWTYLASILVTVDRSGRVDILNHVRDPTIDYRVLVYLD